MKVIKARLGAIKQLEGQLKTLRERSFPFATKSAINGAAFAAQKNAKERIKRDFVVRNRFTEGGVRVNQTRNLDVNRQEAAVGSISKYMEMQEFGGIKSKKGKYGTPIPTSYSAGEAEQAKPRRRLPRRANLMRSIKLNGATRTRGALRSKRQIAKVTVLMASKTNQKFVFLDLVKTRGIFKITGGSRKPKIKMIYDLTRPTVRIKARPWLRPSMQAASKKMPEIYIKALKDQIARQKKK